MSKGTRPARTKAEWLTFGVSVLVLLVVAGLIAEQAGEPDRPPLPRVLATGPVERRDDLYVVPVTVRNEGGSTAESVQVVSELRIGDKVTEADQLIDFLARGESADLAFVFHDDPANGELTVRVAGFTEP